MRWHVSLVLVLLFVNVSGGLGSGRGGDAAAEPPVVDPWLLGPWPVKVVDYHFGVLIVGERDLGPAPHPYRYPVEVKGTLFHPVGKEDPSPVLVFLHGRHATCEVAGFEVVFTHVCPSGVPGTPNGPIPNHRGYDYIARNLASHGYVVVSINANQIVDRDTPPPPGGDGGKQARAELVLHTLAMLRLVDEAGEFGLSLLQGRLDLDRVGLMGHSRGGTGVIAAATRARNTTLSPAEGPIAIRAVLALAPARTPAIAPLESTPLRLPQDDFRDIAFAVVAGYCDGDTGTSGFQYFEAARYLEEAEPAPKFQVFTTGANHNYYNTVWRNDDWPRDDLAWCAHNPGYSGRDSQEDQRRHGLVLIASFLRAYVGDEGAFQDAWEGNGRFAASMCPDAEGPCADRWHLSMHLAAGKRFVVDDLAGEASLIENDLGGAISFEGFDHVGRCDRPWCRPIQPSETWRFAVSWSAPGARIVHEVPLGVGDLTGMGSLTMRVANNIQHGSEHADQDLTIALVDGDGQTVDVVASAYTNTLEAQVGPSGNSGPHGILNMMAIPLSAFAGLDLSDIRELHLVFDRTPQGTVVMSDLMFQEGGTLGE